MKEKGFTLIELLGVIIILAIILAITVPNVTKTLDRANKDMLEDNAKALLSIVKQTYVDYAGSELYIDVTQPNLIVNGQDRGELDYKGEMPKYGCVKVDADGVAYIAVSDGQYCSYKVTETEGIKTDNLQEDACLAKLCDS